MSTRGLLLAVLWMLSCGVAPASYSTPNGDFVGGVSQGQPGSGFTSTGGAPGNTNDNPGAGIDMNNTSNTCPDAGLCPMGVCCGGSCCTADQFCCVDRCFRPTFTQPNCPGF